MKKPKKLASKLQQNKAITLIALVITIIVLLILAGVTINAIVGNDSAMEKAQKAKADNEKADELDTIKLAVVDAVAMGSDGRVSLANLVTALRKIPDVVSASNVNDLETNGTASGPWTIVGQKGSYEVSSSGTVTKINGLSLSSTLGIKEGKTVALTVTKSGSAADKAVSWSKTGNVTFVTSLTDATEVASPTGETVYVKAGALSTSGTGSVTVSATGEDPQTCNITIGGVAATQSTVTTNPTAASGGEGTQANPYVMTVKEGKTGTITIDAKDTNGSATTADSITYSSGTTSVATVTPASETNVSTSTATVAGVSASDSGSVITITIDSVTKYVKVIVSEDTIDYGTAKNPTTYGDTVNYTTTITVGENEVTLSNWKKFYENETETYIIYGDYLPNSAIDTTAFTGITKSNTKIINSNTNRKDLINAMNSSYWNALKTGTINGTEVAATSAVGSPTLELWQASWNAKYPSNKIYIKKGAAQSDGLKGYYVGTSENPSTYYADMSSTEGYNNTLYYPYKSTNGGANGCWLASPSAYDADHVMFVYYKGNVNCDNYIRSDGFRPVVCLPSSVLE